LTGLLGITTACKKSFGQLCFVAVWGVLNRCSEQQYKLVSLLMSKCIALMLLCIQVEEAKGALSAQLLLQLETGLLLSLAVLQLTFGIPDSHPAAQAARDLACQLCSCHALLPMCPATGRYQLSRPAAYTGPQLALQLLPSPLQPWQQQQQQQQQQQGRQQPAEWCAVAPTAPFLSELLPLLTVHCIRQLQQLQQQCPTMPAALAFGATALGVNNSVVFLSTLLLASVVPALNTTAAAEGSDQESPPQSAAATAAAAAGQGPVNTSYILHAHDTLMAHAVSIIRIFEEALRSAAALRVAAAAATTAAGGVVAGAAPTDAAVAAASDPFTKMQFFPSVRRCCHRRCCHGTIEGSGPEYIPSPLVLLALAAGPGSQVQRQLHSLLATMVKLSGYKSTLLDGTGLSASLAAAAAASLLLGDATKKQQQRLPHCAGLLAAAAVETGCSSSPAAAVAELPTLFILGRCCMQWGDVAGGCPVCQDQEPYSNEERWQLQN
jgi:hypothetical protein